MYNELYDIWKREKEKEDEIQQLPKNFCLKIAMYIKKMREENRMLDKKTTKAALLRTEFNNVKCMVSELFFLRHRKFQTKVFAQEFDMKNALTDEEKKLYGVFSSSAEACYVFFKDVLRGYLPKIGNGAKQKLTVLRFVQEIPTLVGIDMTTYGPFDPEDIATLPLENAKLFIKKGIAVKVDPN